MSLMSLSLLLQQCPTCLVHLIWMALEMGTKCPYSCCLVECYFQHLLSIARSILVQFSSSFFSICLVSINVVHSYCRNGTTTAWKKLCFILLDRSDFHMIDNLLIAVHAIESCILMSFSEDEMLLRMYVNLSTDFREPPFRVEMSPLWLIHMYSVLSALTWRLMLPASDCSAGIQLGLVYLPEALYHLRSLHP